MPVTYKYCLVAGISEIVVVVLRGIADPGSLSPLSVRPYKAAPPPFRYTDMVRGFRGPLQAILEGHHIRIGVVNLYYRGVISRSRRRKSRP